MGSRILCREALIADLYHSALVIVNYRLDSFEKNAMELPCLWYALLVHMGFVGCGSALIQTLYKVWEQLD